mgnify:CR=1 FL=1
MCFARSLSYIAYDPQEDTETARTQPGLTGRCGYIAYDPQEDTETINADNPPVGQLFSYIAYDPQEDTETPLTPRSAARSRNVTSPTIRKRILKQEDLLEQWQHVCWGYIAYDPQEDTETD